MLLPLTIILCLASPLTLHALETDNYLSWRQELQDSSRRINDFFLERIQETLPQQRGKSCDQVTDAIAKNFASYLVHDDPISQHLLGTLTSAEMLPTTMYYVAESIYRDPFRFYIPKFGLAPTIQVNGHYFGLDKLSHFGATGKRYLDVYRKATRQGLSENAAIETAINYGIREENTVYGYWASGVFSYADLEADFQGLLFYQRFCHNQDGSYLEKLANGEWVLRTHPDIADYVNAYWDETFNTSYYLPGNWEKIKAVIKSEYCPLRRDPLVESRRLRYQTAQPSFSVSYLKKRRDSGDRYVPDPFKEQALVDLCAN